MLGRDLSPGECSKIWNNHFQGENKQTKNPKFKNHTDFGLHENSHRVFCSVQAEAPWPVCRPWEADVLLPLLLLRKLLRELGKSGWFPCSTLRTAVTLLPGRVTFMLL